ncbi:hypothetical protein [Pseudomonas proteolytica]|uniref:hypothetical protein n=1 Tax=Pseudomonas proteolytica TaxID=219574 RepID=UPI003207DBAB
MTKVSPRKSTVLKDKLIMLAENQPQSWGQVGNNARPNLHGLLRYPAMMVPKMQGDIIDTLLSTVASDSHIIDPFVGSGTIMTEALIRGLNFTGVDINPLAALVCNAKLAIDSGADVEQASNNALKAFLSDTSTAIDADYPNRDKWFSDENAIIFSRVRRAIIATPGHGERSVLWAVFAELVRLCSNSRTTTYKLHIRKPEDIVNKEKIVSTLKALLKDTLGRIAEYRSIVETSEHTRPIANIICGDIRTANLQYSNKNHKILVTSPPYGDNQTTIPYGQFSFLALRWIPNADLPEGWNPSILSNTCSIDSASLGGSLIDAAFKQDQMLGISPSFERFVKEAAAAKKTKEIRKVSSFIFDFHKALTHIKSGTNSSSHWVLTTGNRTVAGLVVPFNDICKDIVNSLHGECITSIERDLPTKRMPSRNSQGAMITTETTMIAEFS